MAKKTIRDTDVKGKRVLVRVDFNVPLDMQSNAITDDSRIRSALPTIKYLIDHKAKVILCSHLGRPYGKVVDGLRMDNVAKRLSQLINLPVPTTPDCIGVEVEKASNNLEEGQVLLLENLRFHPEEEVNDSEFAQALSRLADIYVDDAFGASHRTHASIVGITDYLPALSGLLMEKELNVLESLLKNPGHPFAALLGGAKVGDKIGLIENILNKVNILLIGGGMAANFLKIKGHDVGLSKLETDKLDLTRKLLQLIEQNSVSLILPMDVMVADNISGKEHGEIVTIDEIGPAKMIVDIGPRTVALFSEQLKGCKTIFWNGPMGIFEIAQFASGTKALAQTIANVNATTIVGGGSTAEIVEEMNLKEKMTHVSTGGGASLKFLEGKTLPGVAALQDK